MLVATCEWNEPALVARFLEGLNIDLKDEIYAREPGLVELAIRIDKRFELCSHPRGMVTELRTLRPTAAVSTEEPEPMQLGGI